MQNIKIVAGQSDIGKTFFFKNYAENNPEKVVYKNIGVINKDDKLKTEEIENFLKTEKDFLILDEPFFSNDFFIFLHKINLKNKKILIISHCKKASKIFNTTFFNDRKDLKWIF